MVDKRKCLEMSCWTLGTVITATVVTSALVISYWIDRDDGTCDSSSCDHTIRTINPRFLCTTNKTACVFYYFAIIMLPCKFYVILGYILCLLSVETTKKSQVLICFAATSEATSMRVVAATAWQTAQMPATRLTATRAQHKVETASIDIASKRQC